MLGNVAFFCQFQGLPIHKEPTAGITHTKARRLHGEGLLRVSRTLISRPGLN